jgi:hypothetical protein
MTLTREELKRTREDEDEDEEEREDERENAVCCLGMHICV